ncbi:DNA pilot protein [Blackfly microvirus SF02]|uniref:DNA pilot protein n=1 Tax=Blackfly microvirus SF02 TaxID=2576452 RepID=A0A4P8PK34_9VIRU|nr:DNA pilot protein [Blackfly microvirus SF02]
MCISIFFVLARCQCMVFPVISIVSRPRLAELLWRCSMDPLTIGLITGGFGLLGNMFSSNTSAQNTQANIAMQQQTNQMNVQEAQKNRDFQQQMSSTAYQRSSADMQAAGLNPAMMFGSGSAASTPGGSVPTLQSPKSEKTSPLGNLGEVANKAVSSAVAMKSMDKMSEEIANLETERALIEARRKSEEKRPALVEAQTKSEEKRPAQVEAQTKTEEKRPALVEAQTKSEEKRPEQISEETKNIEIARKLKEYGMNRALFESKSAKDLLDIPDSSRKTLGVTSWGMQKLSDIFAPFFQSAKVLGRR